MKICSYSFCLFFFFLLLQSILKSGSILPQLSAILSSIREFECSNFYWGLLIHYLLLAKPMQILLIISFDNCMFLCVCACTAGEVAFHIVRLFNEQT